MWDWWLVACPYLDALGLMASVVNVFHVRQYWYVIPGFRILLIGLVILNAWFFSFDIMIQNPATMLSDHGWKPVMRFMGNRSILCCFQVWFAIKFYYRQH